MTADFSEARDSILGLVKTAWDTLGNYKMMWPNVRDEIPTTQDPWGRVSVLHNEGRQATLRSPGALKTRYTYTGILTIQVFTPIGEGLVESDRICKVMAAALEGSQTENGVWFRNVRMNEVGPDGDWYQVNIVADFTYDDVK